MAELSIIGPVRSLDISVQSRGSEHDGGVPYLKIIDMPMELSLKFLSVVGEDRMNSERELFQYVFDEVDSAALIVAGMDIQGSDLRGIVDGCVLEPLDLFSLKSIEF